MLKGMLSDESIIFIFVFIPIYHYDVYRFLHDPSIHPSLKKEENPTITLQKK